jgi:protein-disulfide isomerase
VPATAPASTPARTGRLSVQNRIALALLVAAVLVLGLIVLLSGIGGSPRTAEPGAAAQAVREDSHRLSQAPDEKAVLVEFLDFECEVCREAHPLVEELSADYGGNLTVVARYFPLPGHPNSETAAVAVEAAAQQGAFGQMHSLMYEKQPEWAHAPESRAGTFREYAQSLGLDMAAYDDAIADADTLDRVSRDRNEGLALGVDGTPTFFLDGRKIQPSTVEEFRSLIETAIAD